MNFDSESVPEEKQVNEFPSPYTNEGSPYNKNFSKTTYEKCLSEHQFLNNGWFKVCKVIIIGDSSVGKTCIVNRFSQNFFDSNYKTTIGVDFEVQKFSILNVSYTLQIWDTAGQEKFKSIAQSYYRSAHAIVLVFDLSDMESLSNSKKWLTEALHATASSKPFVFLVGTKADLVGQFMLNYMEKVALRLAKHLHAEYWTVSAKTGQNITALFRRIAALSFDSLISKSKWENDKNTIRIGKKLTSTTLETEDKQKRNVRTECCKIII